MHFAPVLSALDARCPRQDGVSPMRAAIPSVPAKPLAGDHLRLTSPLIAYSVAGVTSAAVWAGLIGLLLG